MASVSILELTEENTCKLCDNALGKYTCPKCNILYCSLECYQNEKHLECSEKFYQDCVMENLAGEQVDEMSKCKMLEILKRMHEENTADGSNEELDSDDYDDDDDNNKYSELSERLAGVNLDDSEKVWEKLTPSEKQEFKKFLKSEKIFDLVKQWKPWWLYRCENKILDVDEFENVKKNCPNIKNDIQNFNLISKKAPSGKLLYNVINVLTAYVFTVRYFNGEHKDFAPEAVACISKCSLNLNKGVNFDSSEEAIESVKMTCSNLNWLHFDADNILLMEEDISRIMEGPHSTEKKFYILCCLSDLHDVFSIALNVDGKKDIGEFAKVFPESWFPKSELESKVTIKRSLKKFEFLLSYIKDIL